MFRTWKGPEMTRAMFAFLGMSGGELLLILFVLFVLAILFVIALAVAAYVVLRLTQKKPDAPPRIATPTAEATVTCGRQFAEHANLAGSLFRDVNLAGADFDDANLSNARFHNVNLSNVTFTAAQMGGAAFKHIGPPPDKEGKQERQRPVRFEEMMLCDSTFRKVDLSNVRINDCDLTGMTIDGVPVSEMIAAYQKRL